MAAVLAAGSGAVLSHRSAAALWAICGSSTSRPEVITPRLCRRAGIRAHHIVPSPDEVTAEDGIPVTTPARTLLDLAAVVNAQHLEHAFNEAEIRRLTSPTSLDALVARYRGRRGTAALTHILGKHEQRLVFEATASPSTARARPSRTTAPRTARFRSPAGASSASPRAS